MSLRGRTDRWRAGMILLLAACLVWTAAVAAHWPPSPDAAAGSPAAPYLLSAEPPAAAALSDGTRKRGADGGNETQKSTALAPPHPPGSLQLLRTGFAAREPGPVNPAYRAAIAIRAPPDPTAQL